MMYILQYWLRSTLIDTEETEQISSDLDYLMDFLETRNNNGEAWRVLVDANVYVGGLYVGHALKKDLIENHGCFTLGDSEQHRTGLTDKIKKSKSCNEKGIDKERDKFIKKYDEKKITPTK